MGVVKITKEEASVVPFGSMRGVNVANVKHN